ncbi:MAG: alginate O-acetyltransferase AlgX-related protein [Verrucomicrobiales bacterium]
MKRPPSHRSAALLAACLTLAVGGCGIMGKKSSPESGEEAPGSVAAADSATADESKKEKSETKATKEERPADASAADQTKEEPKKSEPVPAEPVPDPAAAEEFQGLPKGEAAFILACRSLAGGGKATMTGQDSFVFDTFELGALGANSKPGSQRHQSMVAAITAYAGALRAAGVELVLAPVPTKPVVYPDYLGVEPAVKNRRYDSYLQSLYAELEKAGVRVADVTKGLRSDRFDKNAASFPRSGLTWSPAAAAASARAVHAAARSTAAAKSIARDKTIVARDSALAQNGETFKAKSVGWAQGDRLVPATVAKEGAVIVVVGDDHAAAHRTESVNASLADQLSLAFGTAVETRATPRLGWKEATAFSPTKDGPTKLVVWCFSAAQLLDPPPPPPKKAASSSRRPTSRPGPAPRPITDPGTGLRLRDDPGLEGRQD